jgi:uncharacterized protein YndB with AHSA1/START domain
MWYMFHLVQNRDHKARLHVEAEGVARAAPEAVWELVSDASRYCQWGPWSASGYDSPGDPAADGAGAIRWMRYGRTTTVERVLEAEKPRWLVYTVLKGTPARNYRAEITLRPVSDGTHVHWSADWDRTLAGRIVHRKLSTFYPEMFGRLVAAASGTAPGGPDTPAA